MAIEGLAFPLSRLRPPARPAERADSARGRLRVASRSPAATFPPNASRSAAHLALSSLGMLDTGPNALPGAPRLGLASRRRADCRPPPRVRPGRARAQGFRSPAPDRKIRLLPRGPAPPARRPCGRGRVQPASPHATPLRFRTARSAAFRKASPMRDGRSVTSPAGTFLTPSASRSLRPSSPNSSTKAS